MLRAEDKAPKQPHIEFERITSPLEAHLESQKDVISDDCSSQGVSGRYKIIKSYNRPGVVKHANTVINRHQDRLKRYGASMPPDHLYPYDSERHY